MTNEGIILIKSKNEILSNVPELIFYIEFNWLWNYYRIIIFDTNKIFEEVILFLKYWPDKMFWYFKVPTQVLNLRKW